MARLEDVVQELAALGASMGQMVSLLQDLRSSMDGVREAVGSLEGRVGDGGPGAAAQVGGPAPTSSVGGGGGGAAAGAAAGAGRFGAVAGAAAAAAAGAALTRGVISGVRGGTVADFAGGVASGVNSTISSLPVIGPALGELSGVGPVQRVNAAVSSSQGIAALRDIAVAGGELDDELIDQVQGFERQRAERGEKFDQRIQRINEKAEIPVTRNWLEQGLRFGTVPGLLFTGAEALGGEGLRSLGMQISGAAGLHTQK